jgi:hypothetical protein
MSKAVATLPAQPKAVKKPSIKFCPKILQYETGIDYVQLDGTRTKITLKGYVAPTWEDEQNILRIMERDKHCGITTWENREMPAEQKKAEGENRKLQAENASMKAEMEAMRAELDRLTSLTKKPAGGE